MGARVLLNLLNELRKRDKMRGLPSILSLFCNEFNKFNNTGAGMLDSIYHMTLILLKNCIFWCENVKILPFFTQRYDGSHYVMLVNLYPLVVYRFYCMALYHSQTRYHVINTISPYRCALVQLFLYLIFSANF